MSIGTILVGIALLVGTTIYVTRPLKSYNENRESITNLSPQARLTVQRDAVYALIRELDADRQTGKINDEDYQTLRERYVAQGVAILKQLDVLPGDGEQVDLGTQIDAQVLALRQAHHVSTFERAPLVQRESAVQQFCTQCGNPIDPQDRFCAGCGTRLKGTTSQ